MVRKQLFEFFRQLFRRLTHLQISGTENIPDNGGCLIVFNHLAHIDAPLLFSSVSREDFIGLVAKKYQKNLAIRWLVTRLDGIWLDRENPDPKAMRVAIKHLQNGGVLGISPEGTRSKTQQLLPAKPGVAYLVTKAAVPIIPVALWGTEFSLKELAKFRKPIINLHFGTPFLLPPIDRKRKDESLQWNADEIMCRIALMLPKKYHGVYLNHPQLVALQKEIQGVESEI